MALYRMEILNRLFRCPMALQSNKLVELYRRRAAWYDFTANLYYLIGFREWRFRKKAVAALKLEQGETVVEIGCGTGLNFSFLREAVGPGGRIIGVDITDAMLAQARKRIENNGWSNIELVHSDAAVYSFPRNVHGIISMLALSLVPEYEKVIRNGAVALEPGHRWVVADLKIPAGWMGRLSPVLLYLVRPFGATREIVDRRLWVPMRKYLISVTLEEFYLGFAYIAVGEASDGQSGAP